MEILIMIAIGAATLGLIWLIVREPKPVQYFRPIPMPAVKPTRVEVSQFTLDQLRAESAQEARVNAGIPRGVPVVAKSQQKPVDKAPARSYSGSSSRGSSSSSSRSSDSDYSSSYSSWGGDSSSSSSSCDSSSSSSSSCSSD
jgi:hypothetical protein